MWEKTSLCSEVNLESVVSWDPGKAPVRLGTCSPGLGASGCPCVDCAGAARPPDIGEAGLALPAGSERAARRDAPRSVLGRAAAESRGRGCIPRGVFWRGPVLVPACVFKPFLTSFWSHEQSAFLLRDRGQLSFL